MSSSSVEDSVKAVVKLGEEIIRNVGQCYIYHHTMAYCAKNLNYIIQQIGKVTFIESDIEPLTTIKTAFEKILALMPDLSNDNWQDKFMSHNDDIQYYPKTISSMIVELYDATRNFNEAARGLFKLKYSSTQDDVNQYSDYKHLMKVLTEVNASCPTEKVKMITDKAINCIMSGGLYLPKDQKKEIDVKMQTLKHINIEADEINIHDDKLGSGGFGTVRKGTLLKTGEIVAVKDVRMDKPSVNSQMSFIVEITMLEKIHHPFVLELVGAHVSFPYRIVTRFCPGRSLYARLHDKTSQLGPTTLTKIAYQIALGMRHLHDKTIVHRDLKSQNILLDMHDNACVADFGLSGKSKSNNDNDLSGGAGTPNYTAPEILARIHYGGKVDVYSYAIVLWEMLMRRVPYGDFQAKQIYDHVVTCNWRLPLPPDSPKGLKKLITQCWSKNPKDRPTFKEICVMFERGEIEFPGSKKIDCQAIMDEKHCPPLDMDYTLEVLTDLNHKYFDSVAKFLYQHMDNQLRETLRKKNVLQKLTAQYNDMEPDKRSHDGSILYLACKLLEEKNTTEFDEFLSNGGLCMFKKVVDQNDIASLPPALMFSALLPDTLLNQVNSYLPKIVNLLGDRDPTPNKFVLQFLTRFSNNILRDYTDTIADVLHTILPSDIDSQTALDSLVSLIIMCSEELSKRGMEKLRQFKNFLFLSDKKVPAEFVLCLINMLRNDSESIPDLILGILKASAYSDLTQVFKTFITDVEGKEGIFRDLVERSEVLDVISERLQSDKVLEPLLLLYHISREPTAPDILMKHSILSVLLEMKKCNCQRLHIFAALTVNKTFCENAQKVATNQGSKIMDGIIHLLASSLTTTEQRVVNAALRLLLAMSMHETGCNILSENDVLELFVQHFLSSSFTDANLSYTILRNVVKLEVYLPQVPLIASCLLQSLLYDMSNKEKIMDTLVALVKSAPGCVQAPDLQVYVLRLTKQEYPVMVLQALRVLAAAAPEKLAAIGDDVLTAINYVLKTPTYHHPKIIKAALMVLQALGKKKVVLRDFIEGSHLIGFVEKVIQLLPEGDKRAKYMIEFIQEYRKKKENEITDNL